MSEQKSPIEVLADAVRNEAGVELDSILVPEQCMEMYLWGKRHSVSVEECDNEPDEDDTLRQRPQPVEAVPDALTKYAAMWREFRALAKQLEMEENKLLASLPKYDEIYAISYEIGRQPFVLCCVRNIPELMDMLAPWQGGTPLNLAERLLVLRAIAKAESVSDSMETSVTLNVEFGPQSNMPIFWLQMC